MQHIFRTTTLVTVLLSSFFTCHLRAGGEPSLLYDKELAELTVIEDQTTSIVLPSGTPRASNTFCIWANGKIIATGSTIPTDPNGESHPLFLIPSTSDSALPTELQVESHSPTLVTTTPPQNGSWLSWGIGSAAVGTVVAIIARCIIKK